MKITRAGLRGMITEALQEMSMYGGPGEGMEPGSAEEAGEQLLDIVAQITELNRQALDLVELELVNDGKIFSIDEYEHFILQHSV